MENQRLRDALNQVSSNYNTLQMHLITLTQHQNHRNRDHKPENNSANGNSEENNHRLHGGFSGGQVVPRQFMDLGLASAADASELALSPSEEERLRLPLPVNNAAAKELCDDGREDSPEDGQNKVARLNPAKNVDQATEATMRKARVSVRARSEAPMVHDLIELAFFLELSKNIFVFIHWINNFFFFWIGRLVMDANGGSTGKRWRKETRVLALITGAPWLPPAQFESK